MWQFVSNHSFFCITLNKIACYVKIIIGFAAICVGASVISSAIHVFSASRIRHIRQQSAITRSMQSLLRRVSERHVIFVVAESTTRPSSARHALQYLHLLYLLQRWFLTRHLY